LVSELASVRERGYAVDDEEIEPGLRCIGAAIRGHSGEVTAAISIAGPSSRVRREDLDRYADRVVTAARQVSSALGAPSVRANGQARVAGAAG
jgi:DNA-binding IclR family transcriptional regulator